MKKLLMIPALVFALGACSNDTDSTEKTEENTEELHAHEEENAEEGHAHSASLDMEFTYENDEMSVLLTQEGKRYEADRVRFEVVHREDEDATVWLKTEHEGDGNYTADASTLEPGSYETVIHVNGPEDLHEHTSENISVE
ncbi:hypothetical protein [Salinicoccus sp. HZC-1]|uniref:hypothetical protein n=1 Tax=Salinicoccus sp. HZC-1 TaxID=3385497 RepID=UPI00398AF20B